MQAMTKKNPNPGVSREQRISDEGLQRLENHLKNGTRMNDQILEQWIRRYGDSARELIKHYKQYNSELNK